MAEEKIIDQNATANAMANGTAQNAMANASQAMNNTQTTTTITSTPVREPYNPAQLPTYQAQTDAVNDTYAKALEANKQALQNAYELNRAQQERTMGDIPRSYQSAANDVAAQYEKQRMAFNEQANANGINSGAGSQVQLAQNSAYQNNMAQVRTAEADAIAQAKFKLSDLETSYRNSISEAVANNEYQKAVDLLAEQRAQAQSIVSVAQAQADENYRGYQSQLERETTTFTRSQQQAELLAQYGDFSGYASLYGQEVADSMKQAWIASNPDLAYNTGAIDAARYKEITGKNPPGVKSSGGGKYMGTGGGSPSTSTTVTLDELKAAGSGMSAGDLAKEIKSNNIKVVNSNNKPVDTSTASKAVASTSVDAFNRYYDTINKK